MSAKKIYRVTYECGKDKAKYHGFNAWIMRKRALFLLNTIGNPDVQANPIWQGYKAEVEGWTGPEALIIRQGPMTLRLWVEEKANDNV